MILEIPIHRSRGFHYFNAGELLASPAGSSIRVLDLDNTGLLDQGVANLMAGLRGNTTLETLYASANGLSPVGAGESWKKK